jgi:hypothetical protein
MRKQREFLQLPFCNLPTLSVNSLIKISFNFKAGSCRRTPDEREHHIEIAQRLPAQFILMWLKSRYSIGFHLEHAVG